MRIDTSGKVGIPRYTCGRCGFAAIDFDALPVPVAVLEAFSKSLTVDQVAGVRRMIVHACPDGGFGIALISGLELPEQIQRYKQAIESRRAEEDETTEPPIGGKSFN